MASNLLHIFLDRFREFKFWWYTVSNTHTLVNSHQYKVHLHTDFNTKKQFHFKWALLNKKRTHQLLNRNELLTDSSEVLPVLLSAR